MDVISVSDMKANCGVPLSNSEVSKETSFS